MACSLAPLAHRTRRSGALSVSSLLAVLGCAPDRELEPELGSFVVRGEHVEVWASEGIEVCGGNIEHMDRFVEAFRQLVGPRAEAEPRRRYYVLDEGDFEELDRCGDGASGCTVQSRTIYGRNVPSTHELVHAEISAVRHTGFEEGLAEVFGDAEPDNMPILYDIQDVLEHGNFDLPFAGYQRAAHFTRFLIDRHGIDGFLALRDATRPTDGPAELASVFEDVLDSNLGRELVEYEEYPDFCFNAGYRFPLMECSVPPSPWQDANTFVETVDLSCGNDDVLGPFEGELFALRAFEIDELGAYSIEVEAEGAPRARAWVVKCDSECAHLPRDDREYPFEPAQIAIEVGIYTPQAELLYPGKYWLRFSRPVDAPGKLTLRISH